MAMDSIWQETSELPKFPTLNGDLKTDVLIIGGGIAALLLNIYLQYFFSYLLYNFFLFA